MLFGLPTVCPVPIESSIYTSSFDFPISLLIIISPTLFQRLSSFLKKLCTCPNSHGHQRWSRDCNSQGWELTPRVCSSPRCSSLSFTSLTRSHGWYLGSRHYSHTVKSKICLFSNRGILIVTFHSHNSAVALCYLQATAYCTSWHRGTLQENIVIHRGKQGIFPLSFSNY